MDPLSRRKMLTFSAVGAAAAAISSSARAAAFGNPDQPPQGAINANPNSLSDPGPQNPALGSQFPASLNPPATDVGDMPEFWASFNNAHKRVQSGGWAREVTQADFAISDTVSGVNMRLGPGGIRELHWHQQAEWAVMTDGKCRITVLDWEGRPAVRDVRPGDLWYFPAGLPHSLQGMGPSGCEFTIVFDNGMASEFNTLLLTDFVAHTPPEVLAENFNLPVSAFKNIPVENKWIGQRMADPEVDLAAMGRAQGAAGFGPVTKPGDLPGVLQKAIAAVDEGQVAVVDVRVEPGYTAAMTAAMTRGAS